MCVHCATLEVWRQVSQFDCFLWLWFSYLRPFPDVIRWPLQRILWEVSVSAHPSIVNRNSMSMDLCRGCWLSRSGHCNEQGNTKQETFHGLWVSLIMNRNAVSGRSDKISVRYTIRILPQIQNSGWHVFGRCESVDALQTDWIPYIRTVNKSMPKSPKISHTTFEPPCRVSVNSIIFIDQMPDKSPHFPQSFPN